MPKKVSPLKLTTTPATLPARSTAAGRVIDYAYDALSRRATETWYDDVTNAEAQQNARKTYATTYDAAGRVATIGDGDYDFAYTYSIFGNLTSTTQDLTCLKCAVTLKDSGGTPTKIVEYAYDHGQRWVRKTLDTNADGTIEESRVFAHNDNTSPLPLGEGPGVRAAQIVLDFQKTGTATASNSDLAHRYLFDTSVDQLLADETVDDASEDDVVWALTDHLNSVRDLAVYDPITETVSIAKHVTYDAFGNVTSDTASGVESLFLYTARPFDADSGLQNNLNRWYDPAIGRWIADDPARADSINLYRYCENAPTTFVDPAGDIAVVKLGPHYGEGSRLPTSDDNNITTNYRFFDWFNTDLGGMLQHVVDEGTFSFSSCDGVGATISWNETYDEGWVRKPFPRKYWFTDHHAADPRGPARAMEKFFGRKFGLQPANTLCLGEWQVCSWGFTVTATFKMRNAWRNDWVPLGTNLGSHASFGGSGNHTFQATLSAYVLGGGGAVMTFETNENNGPLHGFGKFLYPGPIGVAPPVAAWALGAFHAVSNDSWSITWQSGEAKPIMSYSGGYGPV